MNVVEAGLALGAVVVFGLAGCGEDAPAPGATAPTASVAIASPTPSASVAAPPKTPSPIRVLARGAGVLELGGLGREGVAIWGKAALGIVAGKLIENPALDLGLENPKFTGRVLAAAAEGVIAFAAKRDPEGLWKGDELIYGDDKLIGGQQPVFRALDAKRGWLQVHACDPGERLAGLGHYEGRLVAAIANDAERSYRVRLIAGKPGFAPPSPAFMPEPEDPGGYPESDEPGGEPDDKTGDQPNVEPAPSAPASAADPPAPPPPSAAAPEAEANMPSPSAENCRTRMLPFAFEGGDGYAITIGRTCGARDWWAEHWSKGGRTFARLPNLASERVGLALVSANDAYLAVLSSRTLLRWQGAKWEAVEAPGTGPVTYLASSAKGRVWVIAGGHVYHRLGSEPFAELVLPGGPVATGLIPADEPLTFVAAGRDLYGPNAAAPTEVVDVAPGKATALCSEPYVIVQAVEKRDPKAVTADIAKVKEAGLTKVELLFGHRGLEGQDALQAKVSNMTDAQALSRHLGAAAIVCGAPRNPKAVD